MGTIVKPMWITTKAGRIWIWPLVSRHRREYSWLLLEINSYMVYLLRLPDLQWFQPQPSSILCLEPATNIKGMSTNQQTSSNMNKHPLKSQDAKLTTHPEPCKPAPSAFIFVINASKEPKLWSIAQPRELWGGSPPPSCHKKEYCIR